MESQQEDTIKPMLVRRPSVSTFSGSGDGTGGPGGDLSGPGRRTSRMQRRQSSVMAPGMGPRLSIAPGGFRSHAMAMAIIQGRHAQKEKKYNTYRTQPDNDQRFKPKRVEQVIKEALQNHCEDEMYEPSTVGMLTRTLSDIIKTKVKELNYSRHKIIVHVILGSVNQQGVNMASRCLWSPDNDSYASAAYQNSSLFAVATVYGCYFE
uniref:Tctex1 domain-containing protein 1-B-like n=1 Tax=Saccoglossus kowalevskii TaxID=10224 RepID=A0ABM0MEV9_SACKO|nr:PREDICTED: tctex1 domain-containing protein 1-B-like [Saccoglossus kowalevskii]